MIDKSSMWSKQAPAAVGTTGTIINLLVGFFVGVSSGATVIISQFFRCRRRKEKRVGDRAYLYGALALAGGRIIMVVGLLTSRLSLGDVGVPEEVWTTSGVSQRLYAGSSPG